MPTTQNRRLDPTPLFAVVGVTDLAVERVRKASSPRAVATEVPTRAVAAALEAASKAEAQYEDLAARGKKLVDRLRSQRSTQDLLAQAGNTLNRTKGAVTTARRAADDTATAVRGTIGVGRREAEAVATTTTQRTQSAGTSTKRAAKKTTTRAQKNATATKSAAKGVRTSATKTASAAKKAAATSAKKVGD